MAAYSELYIEQFADFESTIDLTDDYGGDLDLANCVFTSSMKKSYYSSNATNFIIELDPYSSSSIVLHMSANNTANLSPGRYVYDVLLTDPSNYKIRVIEGIVTVLPGVTPT